MKQRNDLDEHFEIPIIITDLNMNEHHEVIKYPKLHIPITWVTEGFEYQMTPIECFLEEFHALRNPLNFELISGNRYIPNTVLRIKIEKVGYIFNKMVRNE